MRVLAIHLGYLLNFISMIFCLRGMLATAAAIDDAREPPHDFWYITWKECRARIYRVALPSFAAAAFLWWAAGTLFGR